MFFIVIYLNIKKAGKKYQYLLTYSKTSEKSERPHVYDNNENTMKTIKIRNGFGIDTLNLFVSKIHIIIIRVAITLRPSNDNGSRKT
jgi:hypothetical protein